MKRSVLMLLGIMVVGCFLTACKAPAGEENLTETPIELPEESASSKEPESTDKMEIAEEPEIAEESATVMPLPTTIDVNQLDNCTVAISLKEGDTYVDDTGVMQMKVTVYVYDLYDMVDLSLLKEGDTININRQDVQVDSLEWNENGAVLINGGLDNGGYELQSAGGGVFYEANYSDAKSYYSIGEATLQVSPDFLYTDTSDLDKDPVIYYPGDFLIEDTGIDYNFVPGNTSIVIENGSVIAMNRVYMP